MIVSFGFALNLKILLVVTMCLQRNEETFPIRKLKERKQEVCETLGVGVLNLFPEVNTMANLVA